jgi:B9 domain-containing protein 2
MQPDETAAWHQPIDLTFAFSSVSGWPMLLLTVMETDAHDRQDLGGYGVLRLPMTPGEHVRQVHISRPYGTLGQHVTAYFVGGRPRYDHPVQALCTSDSRYGHRTVSMGVVEVRISVALQGLAGPDMAHVRLHNEQSQHALDQASVCSGCPPSGSKAGAEAGADDDAEDDEDRPVDKQALLRKQQ